MRKTLPALASCFVLALTPGVALASNDRFTVGDDCSGNQNAVGQPVNDQNDGGEPNAVDHGRPGDGLGSPVAGGTSDFDAEDLAQGFPSEQAVAVTDGARAQEHSNCPNNR